MEKATSLLCAGVDARANQTVRRRRCRRRRLNRQRRTWLGAIAGGTTRATAGRPHRRRCNTFRRGI